MRKFDLWDPSQTAGFLEIFMEAFETLGYESCSDGCHEPEYEKVAIYADKGSVKHAARQMPSGEWTSKMGRSVDIVHARPEDVEGPTYGVAMQFLKR